MKEDNNNKLLFDDIINLPHHVSSDRKHMSASDRAAQFSPFAAVAGYDGAIKESARRTDYKIEMDEDKKTILDEKLRIIQDQLSSHHVIEILFFKQDEIKSGGSYISIIGRVKKIKELERSVIMQDGTEIPIENIVDIKGEMFQTIDDFSA